MQKSLKFLAKKYNDAKFILTFFLRISYGSRSKVSASLILMKKE